MQTLKFLMSCVLSGLVMTPLSSCTRKVTVITKPSSASPVSPAAKSGSDPSVLEASPSGEFGLWKIPSVAKGLEMPKNGSSPLSVAKSNAACRAVIEINEIIFQRVFSAQRDACRLDKVRAAKPTQQYYTEVERGITYKYKFQKTTSGDTDSFLLAVCTSGAQTKEIKATVANGKNISMSVIGKEGGSLGKDVISGVLDETNKSDPWVSLNINQTFDSDGDIQFVTFSKEKREFSILQSFVSNATVWAYWLAKWNATNGYARFVDDGNMITAQSFDTATMDLLSSNSAYKAGVDSTAAPAAGTADFSFASPWDCQAANGQTFSEFPAETVAFSAFESCHDALYMKQETYHCSDPGMPVDFSSPETTTISE